MKNTKNTLMTSVMTLALCIAMLVGTTFAWFTDSASTGVNRIVAGNLDVDLEMLEGTAWVTAEGETLSFKKAAGAENEEILWEPGCTYELPWLRVVNKGNLALKYKIIVSGINGDEKLNEVIKWTIDDQEIEFAEESLAADTVGREFTIRGHMLETAGNEYQGLEIDNIAITVFATQNTVESDSFDDQYDADAELPVEAGSEADLKTALEASKSVCINENIVLSSPLSINRDVTIIGNDNATISGSPVYIGDNANVVFKDVNFAAPTSQNNNASSLYAENLNGKVVFEGCTFTNPQWECVQLLPNDGAEIIINNCTFLLDGTGVYAHGTLAERMLHIQNIDETGDYKATITNNRFIGVDLVRNSVIDVDDIYAFENVTCGGNTFFDHNESAVTTMQDEKIYVNINNQYSAPYVATNTFAQFTQNPAAKLHN